MKLKIATWNMNYRSHTKTKNKAAWDFIANVIAPDIFLAQESKPEGEIGYNRKIWHPIPNRQWGSGVFTKTYSVKELVFPNTYFGSLVGAEVEIPNGISLTVFSMYGLLDQGYATTTIHKMLSDLTFVLMGEGEYSGKNQNVVMGGDLNISIQCDEGKRERYIKAHKICFERIEDFGFVNSFSKFYDDYVQTLRHIRSSVPWQNDYLFVSRNLAIRVKSCKVIYEDYSIDIEKFSDHNPVVIELELYGGH
jgi:exonuclease III